MELFLLFAWVMFWLGIEVLFSGTKPHWDWFYSGCPSGGWNVEDHPYPMGYSSFWFYWPTYALAGLLFRFVCAVSPFRDAHLAIRFLGYFLLAYLMEFCQNLILKYRFGDFPSSNKYEGKCVLWYYSLAFAALTFCLESFFFRIIDVLILRKGF